jgi:hypothetical protein
VFHLTSPTNFPSLSAIRKKRAPSASSDDPIGMEGASRVSGGIRRARAAGNIGRIDEAGQ